MSDEYIYRLIVDELVETCPGETGCHGCQSWCPICGTVSHVCDDPKCDAHRRDTDVKRELAKSEEEIIQIAKECGKLERQLTEGNGTKEGLGTRAAIRKVAWDYAYAEKQIMILEEELREIEAPESNLVPRLSEPR